MRLRRLDLIRYGHFTDKSIDLPAAEVDFHIVYGPNEAGKSTALSAIEDLLKGAKKEEILRVQKLVNARVAALDEAPARADVLLRAARDGRDGAARRLARLDVRQDLVPVLLRPACGRVLVEPVAPSRLRRVDDEGSNFSRKKARRSSISAPSITSAS